ncbi:MAG: hypothetical protein ABJF10_24245 [Chthoniobacter sp.]|uniref:hypothetical protein n=1 Tax=Chthoniobacter sp. TaxID=2510640 RepID=UPI0032A4DED1
MPTLSFVSATVLATTVFALCSPGDESHMSQAEKLTPQIQAMLADLRKATDVDVAAGASSASPLVPLMALANAVLPQIQAMDTKAPRTPGVDLRAEGPTDNTMASLMALATKVFTPSAHREEPQLSPQVQTMITQMIKAGETERAPQGASNDPAASLMTLVSTLLSQSAPGDQAQHSQVAKLTPQIQAMLTQLLKEADVDVSPTGASSNHPAVSAPSSAPTRDANSQKSTTTALQTKSLKTTGLSTGSLDGAPRMTNDEWRRLFPARK